MNQFIQILSERKAELLTATFQHLSISFFCVAHCSLDCDSSRNLVSES